MSKYKVTYFDLPGRAEPIRWILSYMEVDFEDYRFPREKWPELKKEIKFGKVPVLDIDDKRLYQSEAICRYLAQQTKLAGNDAWENQQIDAIIGTIGDIGTAIGPIRMATDQQKKDELLKKLKEETIPYYFNIYNDLAKDGYLANGKLSWADIYFTTTVLSLGSMVGEITSDGKYPNVKALTEKVQNLPGIKKYLEKTRKK